MNETIEAILNFSDNIRYVAIYKDKLLLSKQKDLITDNSSSESDKYEELFVNPSLLKLATQRGNLDCGGLEYIIVAYGNFFQLIKETNKGHISICISKSSDLNILPNNIFTFIREKTNTEMILL